MGRLAANSQMTTHVSFGERKHLQAVAMALKRALLRRHFLAQQLMAWVVVPMTLMESPVVHLVPLNFEKRVLLAASVVWMQSCSW